MRWPGSATTSIASHRIGTTCCAWSARSSSDSSPPWASCVPCRSTIDPTPLAQAIAEIGRIDKTIHTLNFIDDEDRRRSTLQQLNLGEGRHALARDVFHGKGGELYQRYREGQEDQLSALGLVVNMIVLWNRLYTDAILTLLRSEGYPVQPQDEARLSPFGHEHINMLGRYSFAVPEAVTRGELRPLRTATEA